MALSPTGNLLLDSLNDDELDDLLALGAMQPLESGVTYVAENDLVESVYFPTAGTLSLLASPEDDQRVEASSIGREGVANTFAALGPRLSVQDLIGQINGQMFELHVEPFRKAVGRDGGRLNELVFGYQAALFAEAAIGAACNALHHVDQRCARWLLASHDRVDSDTFHLKQEFLAVMIGSQRPTVSIAASRLREAGYITYTRGAITVLNRHGLEDAACACYESIRSAYSRLVPLR